MQSLVLRNATPILWKYPCLLYTSLPQLSKALTRIAIALEKQERTLQFAHCMENIAIDGKIVFQKGDTCILALNNQGTCLLYTSNRIEIAEFCIQTDELWFLAKEILY